MATPNSNDRAFTVVELLVVITVIGVLLALLLPAVQSARESARRATCKNHLRQIATAWHTHMNSQGHFPTGGWPGFTGDPERGFHKKQPGEWTYNILPYIEQQALHEMGSSDGVAAYLAAAAFVQRTETQVPIYNCPTRRVVRVLTIPDAWVEGHNRSPPNNVSRDALGKDVTLRRYSTIDYAVNGGDSSSYGGLSGGIIPFSYEQGDRLDFNWINGYFEGGISYSRSEIRTSDIEDGLTTTYLVGEKRVDPRYYDGPDPDTSNPNYEDDFGDLFAGYWEYLEKARRYVGVQRFGVVMPQPPRSDIEGDIFVDTGFGSAHDSSFHMAFCDASVRAISYDIDPNLHVRLGLRDDGLPADPEMHGPLPPVRRE